MSRIIATLIIVLSIAAPASAAQRDHHRAPRCYHPVHKHRCAVSTLHHKRHRAYATSCPVEQTPPDFDQAAWERETAEAAAESPQEQAADQAQLDAQRAEAGESEAEEEASRAEVDAEIAAAGC